MIIPIWWHALWHDAWTAALVNHLWQSTGVVGIALLLAWSLKKNHARVRYWVWMSASLKFLVPFSLLTMAGGWLRALIAPNAMGNPVIAAAMEQVTQPFSDTLIPNPWTALTVPHSASALPVILLTLWICGVLVVISRFVRAWNRICAAKRSASPLALAANLPVLSTAMPIEPGIVGIFRPMLLLPEGILGRLTPAQLDAVLVHEMSHVRRRDNLTFAVHMLVEALFWFHPAVWWIGKRLIDERERACDEAVVQAGGEAQTYAEGILNVCKFYAESPVACVAGVTGSDLKKRIKRIMAEQIGQNVSLSRKLLLTAFGLNALAVPFVVGWGQIQAAKVMLIHPQDGTRLAFEVATIKPNPDPASRTRIMLSPAHFSATDISVSDMIRFAYGIKSDEQLVGAPNWLKSEHFDIQAKASDAEIAAFDKLGFEEKMAMPRLLLQSLLEDRFQMKATVDTRDLPVYALVVANGGIKMKEVKPDPLPPAGVTPAPGAHLTRITRTGPDELTASAWPMPEFAEQLSHFPDVGNRPVVDETGLKGNYDFVLSGVAIAPPRAGDTSAPEAQGPVVSLFAALPDQLGLKLVPAKAATEVLVIEKIEQPSPN
jgi:bla regulator protein blaR1